MRCCTIWSERALSFLNMDTRPTVSSHVPHWYGRGPAGAWSDHLPLSCLPRSYVPLPPSTFLHFTFVNSTPTTGFPLSTFIYPTFPPSWPRILRLYLPFFMFHPPPSYVPVSRSRRTTRGTWIRSPSSRSSTEVAPVLILIDFPLSLLVTRAHYTPLHTRSPVTPSSIMHHRRGPRHKNTGI